ncbi:hypothetical protein [Paraburkholderia sp.]|uniref:hypothetical protein n=1 Tax=Paraburkholderia sp. TaxID=1926495 RepID=UPI002D418B7C|nr:hypothetical protein [Paraburkholderia sp.]HZZ05214.1 hypothetical protein [Paraburkholderia sp.]
MIEFDNTLPTTLDGGANQTAAQTLDVAVIRVDQLRALAGLLSLEEVTEQFADLSILAQVSIFGLFEDALADIRAALTLESTHPTS